MRFLLQIVAIAPDAALSWRVERNLGEVECDSPAEAVARLDELEAQLKAEQQ